MKLAMFALSAVLALHAADTFAADSARSTRVATLAKTCAACHGANFNQPIDPSYPKLAGQHPDYLAHALTAYKRGNGAYGRNNPIMGAQVAALSDQDIADLAAYIGSLPGSLGTGHR